MEAAHTGEEMPSADDIVAMQDRGDRQACQEQLQEAEAADPEQRRKVHRRWWIRGLAAQRSGRADQYAAARAGEGSWTVVGNAA